jgi:hypothetical protein
LSNRDGIRHVRLHPRSEHFDSDARVTVNSRNGPKLADFGISKMQASRWQRASRAVNSMIRRRDVEARAKLSQRSAPPIS